MFKSSFWSCLDDGENIHIGCSGDKYGSEVKKMVINDNGNTFSNNYEGLCAR